MFALGALLGRQKNILVYRPAQGGGAGLLRLQNKTAPEPLAAPELLVLQNKTAPEPPLPYFGGSTSKKTAPEPPLPYFGGTTSKKTAPEPPLPILLLPSHYHLAFLVLSLRLESFSDLSQYLHQFYLASGLLTVLFCHLF